MGNLGATCHMAEYEYQTILVRKNTIFPVVIVWHSSRCSHICIFYIDTSGLIFFVRLCALGISVNMHSMFDSFSMCKY